jgi:hypothetical protein
LKADTEGVSLVVVEEKKSLVRRSEIGEATRDRAGTFDELYVAGYQRAVPDRQPT